MAVKVALARIERRVKQENRGEVFLRLKPGRGQWAAVGNPATMAAFEAAVVHANDQTEGWAEASFTAPTPGGPVVYLDPGDTEAETRGWVEALAAHLEGAGITGALDVAPQDSTLGRFRADRRVCVPTALHAYSLSTPFPAGTPKPWTLAWGVAPDVTQDLLRSAVEWCNADPAAEFHLDQGLSTVRIGPENAAAVLEATMSDVEPGSGGLTGLRQHPLSVRSTHLTHWGEMVFQVDDDTDDWRSRVAALTETLLLRPAGLDLAVARLNLHGTRGWGDLSPYPPLPAVGEGDVWLNRHLLDRYTPDAHGLQILTDRHLEKARDLSGWHVEEVAPSRFLVRAGDLEPWFAGPEPGPELLAAARHDFGAMILTPTAIAAEAG